MKRFIGLLMVVMLLVGAFCTSFADQNASTTSKEISYDQYINILAKAKNISKSEAIAYDKAEIAKYEKQLEKRMKANPNLIPSSSMFRAASAASGYYISSTSTTKKSIPRRSDLSAVASVTARVYVNGSFREIVSVVGSPNSYIASNANAAAVWEPSNAWAISTTGKFPTTKIEYGAQGRFTIVSNQALTGTAGVGLTFAYTIGQNYYYRTDNMTIIGYKGVY